MIRAIESTGNRRRRAQARFRFAGDDYALWVTDLAVEWRYRRMPAGDYQLGPTCVTVSLSEPNDDGYCYKLVAAVMEKP